MNRYWHLPVRNRPKTEFKSRFLKNFIQFVADRVIVVFISLTPVCLFLNRVGLSDVISSLDGLDHTSEELSSNQLYRHCWPIWPNLHPPVLQSREHPLSRNRRFLCAAGASCPPPHSPTKGSNYSLSAITPAEAGTNGWEQTGSAHIQWWPSSQGHTLCQTLELQTRPPPPLQTCCL